MIHRTTTTTTAAVALLLAVPVLTGCAGADDKAASPRCFTAQAQADPTGFPFTYVYGEVATGPVTCITTGETTTAGTVFTLTAPEAETTYVQWSATFTYDSAHLPGKTVAKDGYATLKPGQPQVIPVESGPLDAYRPGSDVTVSVTLLDKTGMRILPDL
ncbi:hypothetical protein OHA37_38950 [Streptomyces sp. NBC_00335]|uniref:hypothetical protein n=1 Tax=unclassified Streptomyces TaxID=2593676 RepID=UPI00224EEE28|nr:MULTISPECIES: hypothetical protein [unclassified Streptomyces]MCX5409813.1 hypothetical protein [Streptomyces sp. NBC_00086]